MVDAQLNVLSPLLLLLDKPSGQTPTPGVNHVTAFLPLDRRMEAEVLATGQAKTAKILLFS